MIKLLLWILRHKKISLEDRDLILNSLLTSIHALPTDDVITFGTNGTVRVGNKELAADQAIALREGAVNLGKNWTYKVLKEQIAFDAITIGVHKANTPDQAVFCKAALWIQQREKELISKLAADSELFDIENT